MGKEEPYRGGIVLFPEEEDIDGRDWLRFSARNTAFDFLKGTCEDIYTATDGRPWRDEG